MTRFQDRRRHNKEMAMTPEELVAGTTNDAIVARLGGQPLRYLVALGAVCSDRMIDAVGYLLADDHRPVFVHTVDTAWAFATSPGEPVDVEVSDSRLNAITGLYSEDDSDTPIVDLYAVIAGTLLLMGGKVNSGLRNIAQSTLQQPDHVRFAEWCDTYTGGGAGLVPIANFAEFGAYAAQTPEVAVEHEFLLWACDWVEQCAREGLTPTRDLARQSSIFSAPRWQSLLEEPYRSSSVSGL